MKSVHILSVLLSVGLVAWAVACTETVTRIVPPADAGTDAGNLPTGDDDDTTGDDDDTTGDNDAAPPKDAGPPDCKKTKTQNECATCCGDQHVEGFKTYQTAIRDCLCTEALCKTQCSATYCKDKPTTQACATCANTNQTECNEVLSEKCGADPKCVEFNACAEKAGCQAKPQQ